MTRKRGTKASRMVDRLQRRMYSIYGPDHRDCDIMRQAVEVIKELEAEVKALRAEKGADQ